MKYLLFIIISVVSTLLYDPMTGKSGKAETRIKDGKTEVYLQLASGESIILKTFANVCLKKSVD
jgi:hypothetical protein